jgi:hypothetical protein
VKIILAGVAFATLMASPLFAQSQTNERPSHSRVYPKQKKQSRVDYGGLDGGANHPTPNPAPMNQGLCSTAPGFCPDYHGSNGS